jgi:hypothetical protein
MDMKEQHQRLLNGPNANRHMAVVWPEVAEYQPRATSVRRLVPELLAAVIVVIAIIAAFLVF